MVAEDVGEGGGGKLVVGEVRVGREEGVWDGEEREGSAVGEFGGEGSCGGEEGGELG